MIYIIIGGQGSGKTLITTLLCSISPFPVFSNTPLNIPQYRELRIESFVDMPEFAVMVIDEAYTSIDSRTSMSARNIRLTQQAFQMRKATRTLFITAQQQKAIDSRYRKEWNRLIFCSRVPDNSKAEEKWDFQYEFRIKDLAGRVFNSQISLEFEDVKKYFSLFDTYHIVEPIDKDLLEYKMIRKNADAYFEKCNQIAEIVRENIGDERPTRSRVRAEVFKAGFLRYYYEDVYLILNDKISEV